MTTKEQIEATSTELDYEVSDKLIAEINNFLYVYDWVDVLSESELASLRIQLVHFMSNREAQAHAAGVREGIALSLDITAEASVRAYVKGQTKTVEALNDAHNEIRALVERLEDE